MSYVTVEVDIDHGKIVAKEPDKLPEKASGFLTIVTPELPPLRTDKLTPEEAARRLQALHELQQSLQLDEAKAKAWMDMVRDARR
jgi:hypothetical protein